MEKNEHIGLLAKFEMRGIDRVLEGEEVIDALSGTVGLSQKGIKHKEEELCALVLTPTRVILYHKKIIAHSSIDFPLSKINNVALDTGLVFADIKIHSGDDIITMKKISKLVAERFAKNLKMRVSSANNPTIIVESSQAPPIHQNLSMPQAPNIDIADQIKKLADLKAQGFLTEEEFTAQKKKLLGL